MTSVEDFAKDIQIVPSSRSHVSMLIGFFGGSGGGKTVTALLVAIGMARGGKVGIVDTEQKRSGLAADVAKGIAAQKYGKPPEIVAVYLDPPFHPLKYVAAIRALQNAGCKACVVDSISHAWSGDGGYLDLKEAELHRMAGEDWNKREKCAMAAAARTKPQTHGKLVDALLHAKVLVVLCFRSKEKTRMGKDQQGKTVIKKDEDATPTQEAELIYEMLISGECKANEGGAGGYCRFRGPSCKHTHPAILDLLPSETEQFSLSHAEALADWCANPTTAGSSTGKAWQPTADDINALKKQLWAACIGRVGKTREEIEARLIEWKILAPDETLSSLTTFEALTDAIDKVDIQMTPD